MDSLDIVLTVVALIFCLVLAWAAIKFLISLTKTRQAGTGSIKVRQSHYLSSRERLVVVEYRDQNFLLGVGGAGITLIDKSPVDVAAEGSPGDESTPDQYNQATSPVRQST